MEYSARWESTLMGAAFWRMQDENNPFDNDYHGNRSDKHLLQRQNRRGRRLSDVSSVRAVIEHGHTHEMPKRPFFRHRRSSMSDVHTLKAAAPNTPSRNRFLDFSMRARSRSPSKALDIGNKNHVRTGRSLIRSAFGSPGNRGKRNRSVGSMSAFNNLQELGSPSKPLLYFRGGASWQYMERELDVLCLDLFWPIKEDAQEENDMIRIEELRPLSSFRGLRVLKLTGMMQSYQSMIWQAAWLNRDLEELELEMALEPCIRRSFDGDWPSIKGDWQMRKTVDDQPVYRGQYGDGTLHRSIGIGEYLDKTAIEASKMSASMMGPTRNRLSIVVLTLTGFVVDADPFYLWFDPKRLRRIHLKNDCVDAGFHLPENMKDTVEIVFPKRVKEYAMTMRPVDPGKEIKVVELRKGEKVGEWPYLWYGGSKWDFLDEGWSYDYHNESEIESFDTTKTEADFTNEETEASLLERNENEKEENNDQVQTCNETKTQGKLKHRRKTSRNLLSTSKITLRSRQSQPSIATSPRRRRIGGLLYGRRAIVPRMVGKFRKRKSNAGEG